MTVTPAFYPTMFAWAAVVLSALLFAAVLIKWKFRADDISFLFLILCNLAWDAGFIFSWPFKDPNAFPYRLMFGAACFLPGAFLDFMVRSVESPGRRAGRLLYAVGLGFFLVSFVLGITYRWKVNLMIFIVLATLLALFIIGRAWRNTNPVIRFRARYMLVAVLAASIGGLADLVQGLSGRPLTGALGSTVALAILAVATARLEVVAVHPLALDLVVYSGLGAVYAGAGFGLNRLIGPIWASGLTALLAIMSLRPAAEAIRLFLKRVLLGIKIQDAEVVGSARKLILTSRSESELTARFCAFLNDTFKLTGSTFSTSAANLSPREIEALRQGPVTASDTERLPDSYEDHLRGRFDAGELGAAFGFFRDHQFAGTLLLAPKTNGRRFFPDELRLIETLGEELTFAHENLRLNRRERLAQMGEAVAQVSHEIKNPLTTIIASAEILQSGHRNPELHEVGHLVVSELRRLKQIVNQYLEFARPCDPVRRSFDLAALAREIAKTTDGVRVESNGPVPVEADESGMRQIFLNLIQNARDAGGRPPVAVHVKLAGGVPVVQIRDRGPGIDPAIRDRLFEPFVTGKSGGTGLGLAICKRIVDAHGGDISAASGPDGTTVEFRLGRSEA